MLCENCKKENATFHYRHSENGNVTEAHLCGKCAAELGYLKGQGKLDYGDTGNLFSSPLSFFFAGKPQISKTRVCHSCGLSEYELRKNGLIGCSECYNTFSDIIGGMLEKYQLSTKYKGKIPGGMSERTSLERQIEKLETEMRKAVENQEYEEAARLRDAIKGLKNSGDEI